MRAAGESCSSAGENHVERRPRAFRTWLPVNVTWVSSADEATRLLTRPEAPVATDTPAIGSVSFSCFATAFASKSTGPQSWYGESVSYGICDGDEVRHVDSGRFERRHRATAGRREEERVRDLAVVEDDLPFRRVDGGARRGRLGRDAAVHLAARVAVEVERTALRQVRERVRPRGDRLRLERGGRPLRRHLRRDDALQVLLEADHVDHVEQLAVERERELAAVRDPADGERRLRGDLERRLECVAVDRERRVERERSGVERRSSRRSHRRSSTVSSSDSVTFCLEATRTRTVATRAWPSVVPG